MTLFTMSERQTPVTTVPHRLLLAGWKARLEASEIRAIDTALDQLVGRTKGNEISTVRWLPREISPLGRDDWEGSAFMRLWDKACEGDRARTCWCFAVFLFDHMLRRPDAWQFIPLPLGDVPLAATKYYRCSVHTVMRLTNQSLAAMIA